MKAQKEYEELVERIIAILQKEREKQGLSKYAMERESGVSQQMIGYVEKGSRKPSLEIALRMADGLGLDLAKVIKKARSNKK